MEEKYDVVIVGAGPAGLSAAKHLAENNKKVIVLEKDEVAGDKLCGGGLTKKDLDEINIPTHLIEREFNSIDLFINKRLTKAEIDEPFVWTINRKKLGKWQMEEAEKAGAKILLSTKVEKIEKDFVVTADNTKISYNYLIGADGSNSLVRKYLGLQSERVGVAVEYRIPIEDIKNERMVMYNDLDVNFWYFWIFPHKEFALVGTGSDPKTINAGELKEKLDSWCEKMGIDAKKYELEAASLNYDYKGVKFGNTFLVGDAAGLLSALTGEGIHPAIISGTEVARKIINPDYGLWELKEVLKWKRFEEKIVSFYTFNKVLAKIFFAITFLMFKNYKIKKKAIKFLTLK